MALDRLSPGASVADCGKSCTQWYYGPVKLLRSFRKRISHANELDGQRTAKRDRTGPTAARPAPSLLRWLAKNLALIGLEEASGGSLFPLMASRETAFDCNCQSLAQGRPFPWSAPHCLDVFVAIFVYGKRIERIVFRMEMASAIYAGLQIG